MTSPIFKKPKQKNLGKKVIILALATLSIMQAQGSEESQNEAQIQTRDKTEVKRLNEVTATGSRSDLPLELESKNTVIIDKSQIEDKGYTNLEQALEQQPMINLTTGANGNKEIDIRGQGADAARAVKVLINGVPINLADTGYGFSGNGGFAISGITPFNLIDINDVEQIEIIPGGGSVLYGSGTRGGVINFVTRKPSKNYARFSMKTNSFERNHTLGSLVSVGAGHKIGDKLFISGGASYQYQNGPRPNEFTQNFYASLQTIYEINEKQKLDIGITYANQNRLFAGYHSLLNADGSRKTQEQIRYERYRTPTQTTTNGPVLQNTLQISAKHRYDISESLGLDSLLYYAFSSFLFPDVQGNPITTQANVSGTNINNNVGLHIKGSYKTQKNTLLFGINNEFEKSGANSGNTDKRDGLRYGLALLVIDSYQFANWFSLTAGARGELWYYNVSRTGFVMNGNNTINVSEAKGSYALELTPSFNYSDSGSIYAKVEAGYISPSVNQIVNVSAGIPNQVTGTSGSNSLKPEQYFTGEIGWRDEYTNIGAFSASVFYTHTFNEIRYIYQLANRNFYNLGETQRFGFELTGKHNLFSDILEIQESVALNYSNVLVGRSETSGSLATNAGEEGNRIPYVPIVKVSLLINVEAYRNENHTLKVFFNNTYFGSQVDNRYNVMNEGGYLLMDLGLTYKYKQSFSISAGARNLLDWAYVAYQTSTGSSAAAQTTTGINYLAGEGRNYFIEGRYSF